MVYVVSQNGRNTQPVTRGYSIVAGNDETWVLYVGNQEMGRYATEDDALRVAKLIRTAIGYSKTDRVVDAYRVVDA
jgi:cation transport regulator ChaC